MRGPPAGKVGRVVLSRLPTGLYEGCGPHQPTRSQTRANDQQDPGTVRFRPGFQCPIKT